MNEESFDDNEVAEILNRDYISIKVDKEERPDIDKIYMKVCQLINGSGGWPLTIIMTPQEIPFFAATYIPKSTKSGGAGLVEVLNTISSKWLLERHLLEESGLKIYEHIKRADEEFNEAGKPDKNTLENAYYLFAEFFDKEYGGFSFAPKFPSPYNLLFLLRYSAFEKKKNALKMVEKTLLQMFKGGIYDHLGGGFSRYSTDEEWLVPHFEKMLYDNVGLAYVYLEAYMMTKCEIYGHCAKGILGYVLKEMTSDKGGFYSSQDADSEGVEGKYYVFTPGEIIKVLGWDDGKYICKCFDITAKGNS